ncbi:MAG: hypothetical protein L3K26_11525, partial [Candidatus Hydrogenedentes bacterium]|nr:hypothetical protein [Candidatus Hydrogenedentota bacterium]
MAEKTATERGQGRPKSKGRGQKRSQNGSSNRSQQNSRGQQNNRSQQNNRPRRGGGGGGRPQQRRGNQSAVLDVANEVIPDHVDGPELNITDLKAMTMPQLNEAAEELGI